jgi:hypothetical protein
LDLKLVRRSAQSFFGHFVFASGWNLFLNRITLLPHSRDGFIAVAEATSWLADFFNSANFFIASSRFWSRTCAYRGTICVDECPSIWAIVSGDTPALAQVIDRENGSPAFFNAFAQGNKTASEMVGNNVGQLSPPRNRKIQWLRVLSQAEISSIVEAGGGRYVGVLSEIPEKMESIILFISPQTRTTLGIPMSRLTVDAVREQLAESDAAFAEAGSKWQMQSARA